MSHARDPTASSGDPASLAVALRYEQGRDGVPHVIASGRGHVADRIVAAAREAGIPVEHDDALARALGRLELDQPIPPELYRAVGKVIGFLMRKGRLLT